jgi:transcriptional regulator with XRE-family HTH domain
MRKLQAAMTGSDLKAWRKAIGWTQSHLMTELEVKSRQTVAAWEKTQRLPRLVELAIVALDQVEACRKSTESLEQFTSSSIISLARGLR